MAVSGMRDLSIIATPPARRLSVRTFVMEQQNAVIKEALLRELLRGGQVYYLHNEVKTIEKCARDLAELVPEARIGIGHGQMHERELEQVMSDFYHKRFNVLVASTIIETGIDVPSANTILIERADKFGLAQLHQLRGRVGRSHHQAYAYLLTPPRRQMTPDAEKRLEAIANAQDLGAGFVLATHDLEIRGAGELLGDGQSGQIQAVGFTLYMEMLERAVKAIRKGEQPNLEQPLGGGPEVNLRVPALIPEDYLPDVHARLILYKRIANAPDEEGLRELQVEMIDRFGLLPDPAKNLMRLTLLKLQAEKLGILKVDAGPQGGRIEFAADTQVDPLVLIKLIQGQPNRYKFEGATLFRFQVPISGEHSIHASAGDCHSVILVRKVSEPNPEYRMVASAPVINWFDADEIDPEYYSVADKLADIRRHPEAGAVIDAMMAQGASARGDVADAVKDNPALQRMMGRMTLISLLKQSGADEQAVMQLNRILQRYKKV